MLQDLQMSMVNCLQGWYVNPTETLRVTRHSLDVSDCYSRSIELEERHSFQEIPNAFGPA